MTVPGAPDAAPAPPPPELSRFSVPLEYDISAVLRTVESVVPRRFGSMDEIRVMNGDSARRYAFAATRGPFTAFVRGPRVHLRATLSYEARGWFKPRFGPTLSAGCGGGSQPPRVTVELSTPLSLTPDWHLVSRAAIERVAPASGGDRDRCKVSVFRRDVTDDVVRAARSGLQDQLRDIDRRVAGVSLEEQVSGWWSTLGAPIQLTRGVWLVIAPERLAIGRVRGESRTLTIPVSLAARPQIVTSVDTPSVELRKLPSLARDSATNGFRIALDGVVDYAAASRQLSAILSERPLTQGGQTIRVVRASLLPGPQGRLVLSLAFAGDARGMLFLEGTPKLDFSLGQLVVPDLDFDLRSSSELLKTYAWLKSDDVRAMLRERARLPLAPALEKGRELLVLGLNRRLGDAVTLSGAVDSVAVNAIFVTRDGIVVRALAAGRGSGSAA